MIDRSHPASPGPPPILITRQRASSFSSESPSFAPALPAPGQSARSSASRTRSSSTAYKMSATFAARVGRCRSVYLGISGGSGEMVPRCPPPPPPPPSEHLLGSLACAGEQRRHRPGHGARGESNIESRPCRQNCGPLFIGQVRWAAGRTERGKRALRDLAPDALGPLVNRGGETCQQKVGGGGGGGGGGEGFGGERDR